MESAGGSDRKRRRRLRESVVSDGAGWFEPIHAGDRDALDALFSAHWAPLCRYAATIVESPAAAEDVVQDVFVELWARRSQLAPQGSAGAYLFRATRNRSLNHLRGRLRRVRRLLRIDTQTSEPARIDAELDADALQRALEHALTRLPDRPREVFILHRYGGLTYGEIASVLDVSPKTIERHMGRALELLHRWIRR